VRRVTVAPRLAQVAAVVAVVLAGGVGAWSVATAELLAPFAALVAEAGFAMLVVGLVAGLGVLVGPAGVFTVVAYGLSLIGSGSGLRADAVVVGPVLWLALEAAWWSLEARHPIALARGLVARRAVTLVGTAAGSGGVALVLLDLAATGTAGGALLKAVGVAAALGIVALLAALARPRPGQGPGEPAARRAQP
jgi:hypothetical protein